MTTYSPTLSTNAHGILSGSVYLPVPVYRASAFNASTGSMAAIGATPLAAYKSGNVVSFLTGAVATDIEYRPNAFTGAYSFLDGDGTQAYDTNLTTYTTLGVAMGFGGGSTFANITYYGMSRSPSQTSVGYLRIIARLLSEQISNGYVNLTTTASLLVSYDGGTNWDPIISAGFGMDVTDTFTVTSLTQNVSQLRVKFETTADSAWDEWGNFYSATARASIYDIAFIGT